MSPRIRLATGLLLLLIEPSTVFATQEGPVGAPVEFERTDESGKVRARVRETIIGFNDPAMNQEFFLPSPDGRRVAYMILAGDGLAIVVDGVQGELYEGIADNSLTFSPDGEHLAYVGTRPGSQFVVLDGKPYRYDGVSKQGVVFSEKGGRFGWVGARDKTQVAVIDGEESPPYQGITPQGILFSEDGEHYAYCANSGTEFVIVLDGEPGPLFDTIGGLRFTTKGHIAYVGLRKNDRFVVVDHSMYGPYDDLRSLSGGGNQAEFFEISADGSRIGWVAVEEKESFVVLGQVRFGPYADCAGLSISPEGSRVAFLANNGDGWSMLIDGEPQPHRSLKSLSFSPSGLRLGSILQRNDKHIALIDGVEGEEYDRIEEPGIRFAPDGKRTTYLAMRAGERIVVVDGVEGPPFSRLGKTPLCYAPNSSRVMYSVRRGSKESLVIDGEQGPLVNGYRSVTFSPDGSRYAYSAERAEGEWIVVVDGEIYGPGGKLGKDDQSAYRSLGKQTPTFSLDGKKVGWIGVREEGWVAVVDGVESSPYDLIVRSTFGFSPDGDHLAFVAVRDDRKIIVIDGFEVANDWDGFLRQSEFTWDGPRQFSIRGTREPQYLLIEVSIP